MDPKLPFLLLIVFDFDEVLPPFIHGSAAVILALSVGYYLSAIRGAPAKRTA